MLIVVLPRCWVTPPTTNRADVASSSPHCPLEASTKFCESFATIPVYKFPHLFRRCPFCVNTYKIAAFSEFRKIFVKTWLTALLSTSTLSTTHIAALLSHVLRRTDGFHVCESGKLSRQTPAVRIQSLNIH